MVVQQLLAKHSAFSLLALQSLR